MRFVALFACSLIFARVSYAESYDMGRFGVLDLNVFETPLVVGMRTLMFTRLILNPPFDDEMRAEFREFRRAFTARKFAIAFDTVASSGGDEEVACVVAVTIHGNSHYPESVPLLRIHEAFFRADFSDTFRQLALLHEWTHVKQRLENAGKKLAWNDTIEIRTPDQARGSYRVELEANYVQARAGERLHFQSELMPFVAYHKGGIGLLRLALALNQLKIPGREKFREVLLSAAAAPMEGVPLK